MLCWSALKCFFYRSLYSTDIDCFVRDSSRLHLTFVAFCFCLSFINNSWGPVHTYPEISVYALQSANVCIRCVSGYVWTLVSVYFCIRWRHSIRTSLNAHALLTNPLRCPDTNRIRVDGRIRFVYATCERRYFCIRIKKFADTKISRYVWTGPKTM